MAHDRMRSRAYDKLVRDRIPEIIRESGEQPITREVDGEEYGDRLAAKLLEEATEFEESRELDELADVLEVVFAVLECEGIALDELEERRREKHVERGGFSDGIVLERVEYREPSEADES